MIISQHKVKEYQSQKGCTLAFQSNSKIKAPFLAIIRMYLPLFLYSMNASETIKNVSIEAIWTQFSTDVNVGYVQTPEDVKRVIEIFKRQTSTSYNNPKVVCGTLAGPDSESLTSVYNTSTIYMYITSLCANNSYQLIYYITYGQKSCKR